MRGQSESNRPPHALPPTCGHRRPSVVWRRSHGALRLPHRRDRQRARPGRRSARSSTSTARCSAGFSAGAFVRELVRMGRIDVTAMAQGVAAAARFQFGGVGFSGFVAETVGVLKGMPESELEEMGERLFTERARGGGLSGIARARARASEEGPHGRGGVVGAALPDRAAGARSRHRAHHVHAARDRRRRLHHRRRSSHPSCYGVGKAIAARDFAAARGIDLTRSFFYTDSDEDLPLLDIVGRPRPINPSARRCAPSPPSAAGRRGASPAAACRRRASSCARCWRSAAPCRRSCSACRRRC